jgi:hypothetical protein
MHDTRVVLKNGRTITAPLWTWRPSEGWFSLVCEADDPTDGVIKLSDAVSAVTYGTRTRIDVTEDVDLLAKARKEGWDGR